MTSSFRPDGRTANVRRAAVMLPLAMALLCGVSHAAPPAVDLSDVPQSTRITFHPLDAAVRSYRVRIEVGSVACDHYPATGRVVWMGQGRSKQSLLGFFEGMREAQKAALEASATDMHETYIQTVRDASGP